MAVNLDANKLTYMSMPIVKTEETDEGIIVYGKASDGRVDSDDQIVASDWSGPAIAKWLDTGANLRVQHNPQLYPAGKGLSVELDRDGDGGHWVKSLVVEPTAMKLVRAGVLRAYSVGIAKPVIRRDMTGKARGGIVAGGDVAEISLVDRPANTGCGITLVKSEGDNRPWTYGDLVDLLVKAEATQTAKGDDKPDTDGGTMARQDDRVQEGDEPAAEDDNDKGEDLQKAYAADRRAWLAREPGPGRITAVTGTAFLAKRAAEDQWRAWNAEGADYATFEAWLAKRDFDRGVGGGVDRDQLDDSDFAGPGRSYPIVTPGDVSDAAHLVGHADNPGRVRRRIKAIAQRKGPEFEAQLPGSWQNGVGKNITTDSPLASGLAPYNLAGDDDEDKKRDMAEADLIKAADCPRCGEGFNATDPPKRCPGCGKKLARMVAKGVADALSGYGDLLVKAGGKKCRGCGKEYHADAKARRCEGCGKKLPRAMDKAVSALLLKAEAHHWRHGWIPLDAFARNVVAHRHMQQHHEAMARGDYSSGVEHLRHAAKTVEDHGGDHVTGETLRAGARAIENSSQGVGKLTPAQRKFHQSAAMAHESVRLGGFRSHELATYHAAEAEAAHGRLARRAGSGKPKTPKGGPVQTDTGSTISREDEVQPRAGTFIGNVPSTHGNARPQKPAKPKASTADHVTALRGMDSREAAVAHLANVKGKDLDALARNYHVPGYQNAAGKRRAIVEASVGNRLDSRAIRGDVTLPYDDRSGDAHEILTGTPLPTRGKPNTPGAPRELAAAARASREQQEAPTHRRRTGISNPEESPAKPESRAPSVSHHVSALASHASREQAADYLAGVKGKELDALAHHYHVTDPRAGDKRRKIIEATIGNRLDSHAIRGDNLLPYGDDEGTGTAQSARDIRTAAAVSQGKGPRRRSSLSREEARTRAAELGISRIKAAGVHMAKSDYYPSDGKRLLPPDTQPAGPHREPDGNVEELEADAHMPTDHDNTDPIPASVMKMHDAFCPVYDWADVAATHTLKSIGDAIDLDYFTAAVLKAAETGDATGIVLAGTYHDNAAAIAKGNIDPDVLTNARDELHKSFSSLNPQVMIGPAQFRRAYIQAGHAPMCPPAMRIPMVPPASHVIHPDDFHRGLITDGHQAESPSDGGNNLPTHSVATGMGKGFMATASRQAALATMRALHDHIVSDNRVLCPLSVSRSVMDADMGATNRPTPINAPVAAGLTKAATIDDSGEPAHYDESVPESTLRSGEFIVTKKRLRTLVKSAVADATGTFESRHQQQIEDLQNQLDELGSQPDLTQAPLRGAITKAAMLGSGTTAPVGMSLVEKAHKDAAEHREHLIAYLQRLASPANGNAGQRNEAQAQLAQMLVATP